MPEVSPAKRSRIIREIHADPERRWTGSIGGYRVEIKIEGREVRWRVCVSRHWHEGVAANIWCALLAVEGPFPPKGKAEGEPASPLFSGRA